MTDQPDVSRANSARTAVARTVRTFVVVFALLTIVAFLGLELLATRGVVDLTGIVNWVLIPLVLGVSTLVTGWLVNGGYERFDADPSAAGRFGWLVLLYVPFALLPTRMALDAFGFEYFGGSAIVLGLAIVLAGWLVYGGGDSLGIETRHVGHAAIASIVLLVGGSVIASTVASGGLLGPAETGLVAVAAQLVALWVGFSGTVDRLLS
ncbi:hypothetical protein C479_07056 [Halovivax asiaticus JCM 14624]|uniref:Uncharacterized protein n=1 Tax=Halovivax asiaticus JCM 14624 TaxID=1227490 RepID=M0BMA1_9EURY|nr:hypothetical protein [Halovivax asiaticus]ELZ11602.1 hypothetical protein C479_07056 [Halovivax asiaticus JCM 14624]